MECPRGQQTDCVYLAIFRLPSELCSGGRSPALWPESISNRSGIANSGSICSRMRALRFKVRYSMRFSEFGLTTLKEIPAEAEIVSHQLMLRAGLIRRLASGLFTWMPIGLRVLRKVEAVVREEMDRAGALELLMPAVQPAELWHESERDTE